MKALRFPPIFFFALLFAAGVLIEDRLHLQPALLIIPLIMAAVGSLLNLRRPWRGGAGLPYALFFLTGLLLTSLLIAGIESGPLRRAALAGREAVIEGSVVREPTASERGTVIELAVEKVSVGGEAFTTSETARVVCSPPGLVAETGSRLAVYGRPSIPGGRDVGWREYFYHKGISAQLTVSPGRIERLEEDTGRLNTIVNRTRNELKRGAARNLEPNTAGLLVGLILGDTRGIDDETKESFRVTGLSHVLAVSGLNVMFLVAAFWPLLKLARASSILQFVLLSAAIWFYAVMAEGTPSVLRASIMAEVIILAWLTGRNRDATAAVSLAGFVLLAIHPFFIFDVGFQLSFAATLALVKLSPIIAEKFASMPRRLAAAASTSLAAQLGVAPVIAAYFGQLSIVTLPANLVVVPISAPPTVLGVVAVVAGYVSPSLASPIYRVAGLFIRLMTAGARFFASLPASSIPMPSPGAAAILFYYLALIIGATILARWRGRLSFAHLLALLLVPAVAVVVWQAFLTPPPSGVEILFLDVGQGDATLIRDPGGATALVDAGPDGALLSRHLAAKGIRRIDLAILTHPHADHRGGFPVVLKTTGVGRFIMPVSRRPAAELTELTKVARSRGVAVEESKPGRVYHLGSLSLEVLSSGPLGEKENDSSTILKLSVGDFSLLLPGDAEEEAERSLLSHWNLRSSVLKVAHHGGATAADPDFLKAVSPKIAVISVGAKNRYGLPSSTAIGRLKSTGSSIFRTDRDGSVRIVTDGKTMEVATER